MTARSKDPLATLGRMTRGGHPTVESKQIDATGSWSARKAAEAMEWVRTTYRAAYAPIRVDTFPEDKRELTVEEAYERTVDHLQPGASVTWNEVNDGVRAIEDAAMSRNATVFMLSPIAHDAVVAAAATLSPEDILGRSETDFEFLDGIVVFPRPVWYTAINQPHVNEISALSVHLRSRALVRSTGEEVTFPALEVTRWQDSAATHPSDAVMPVPLGLIPDGSCSVPLPGAAALHPSIGGVEPVPLFAPVLDVTCEITGEDIHTDVDVVWPVRYLYALSRLMQTNTLEPETVRPVTSRKNKNAKGKARGVAVNVIHLSHAARESAAGHGATGMEYTCQWVVRMHKVRQWYPSEGVHKVIWRGPYVKGPSDAPMKPRTVTVLD